MLSCEATKIGCVIRQVIVNIRYIRRAEQHLTLHFAHRTRRTIRFQNVNASISVRNVQSLAVLAIGQAYDAADRCAGVVVEGDLSEQSQVPCAVEVNLAVGQADRYHVDIEALSGVREAQRLHENIIVGATTTTIRYMLLLFRCSQIAG